MKRLIRGGESEKSYNNCNCLKPIAGDKEYAKTMSQLWSEVKIEIPSDMGELAAEIFQEEGAGGIVYDDPAILDQVVLPPVSP